jgi:FAD/FMN-containing dehydrogenase
MDRRDLLKRLAAIPVLKTISPFFSNSALATLPSAKSSARRVRPSDPAWPSAASWEKLKKQVGGNLIQVQSPLAPSLSSPDGADCQAVFKLLKNPYYIGDQAGATQTSGWVDAWTSSPSVYALAAKTNVDVVAGVNFARENNLRLVVKGGGHSYQGTSNAPDSLLIWTRAMNNITMHDAFVAQGCQGKEAPQPAVTVGAGAIWMHTYDAVTTKAGRYVQGGGCGTVGVAGLIQSGGFGSFSKNYGMAAAALLEAEVVTADGVVRIANAYTHPDLFWGIKGGGGGSLGVLTRLTLRTRDLPNFFGGVFVTFKAASDAAYQRLIAEFIRFYSDSLFNPHWGESVAFHSNNTLSITMVFQGLDTQQAENIWHPFFDWISGSPQDFSMAAAPRIGSLPARNFWDPEFLRKNMPSRLLADDRPGAPESNIFWAGNLGEAGWFLHGYESAWMPAFLLKKDQQKKLADALFGSSRYWQVSLHFNKGLAGAPAEAIAAARDTAMNPAVLDALALAIIGGEEPPAFPGIPGHEPDLVAARKDAAEIDKAMSELRKIAPNAGSYVSESNYFEPTWQQSFWGSNYPRLQAVKKKYDPDCLFFVHHGVGSEDWSHDGFTRVTSH